jgi:NodT family efflux transporter outer membrane factor (OMF) lipoprotein
LNSPELNRLVDTAFEENLDIRSSWARLRQARAAAVKSRAGLFPAVDTGLEASQTRTYRDYDLLADTKSSSLDLAASFELDLWGRVRSGYRADQLSALAAHEDVRAAAISLTGEVVDTWVELLAARQEMQVVQDQIHTNEMLLKIQTTRFENGMASALDITQQQELLANSRSALPPLQARERVAVNKLAVLLGQSDVHSISIRQHELPQPMPRPKTGVPADLLMSRPDVRAAYYQLRAADFEVSVARADRLPSLSLSARTAISSDDFSLAWGDWLTRLGTNFSAPLFDAGARKAEVERTRAVVDERLAEYTATVLEAIREVQDALANISGQEDRIAGLEDELRAAKQARDQARLRYLKGQSDYLNFVTQQRSVQTLQRNLVAARADLLSFQVALYRALGGGGGQEYS